MAKYYLEYEVRRSTSDFDASIEEASSINQAKANLKKRLKEEFADESIKVSFIDGYRTSDDAML